jgi:iron complex outermembrane recepter protein
MFHVSNRFISPLIALTCVVAPPIVTAQSASNSGAEPITDMEKFIATETALDESGELLPSSRPTSSVFGEMAVFDTPRALTVLTPELMAQFDIQDFSDLGRIGAGTQQRNYYGVPGTPVLRGAEGGVFFNGIQRAFQRNEMPLSFGSVEAMDVVKGPAPAHFGVSQAGGYTNLLPKSPFFDRQRSIVTVEVGSDDEYRAQLDTGAPIMIGDRPAAYRLSLTGQYAGSPYDRVRNDFVSVYGALKVQLSPATALFTGTEVFSFKSNENAGWNRPTQSLIDRGEYVIGEPINIASSAWEGRANRYLLYQNPALVVPAAIVDAGVSRGLISAAQRAAMLNLADPADRATAYAGVSASDLATISPTTSGYQYTPAYFAAGGNVFTAPIATGTVLADENDFADADNLLYFADLVSYRDSGATLTGQFLLDYISTDKSSTYGYATNTNQLVMEAKGSYQQSFDFLATTLTTGLSARRTQAKTRQDFFDEPFSRRDITRPSISGNSVIPVGAQTDPDGVNFWSPTAQGGANAESTLWLLSAFAFAENQLNESLTTYTSLVLSHAPYETEYPRGVDRVPADDPRRDPISGEKDFASFSFSPVWSITDELNAYVTIQRGTSIDPLDGGAIIGRGNFAENVMDEIGLKASLVDDTLFASIAAYQWEQTAFNVRENNAEELEGEGVEFEVTFAPHERFALIGSVGRQQVRRNTPLGFRSIPLTEEQWALYAGQLNTPFSGIAPAPDRAPYPRPASNPDLEYPGIPEEQVKLHAYLGLPAGFNLTLSARWSAAYWHNFDRTLRLPATTVVDASVGWRNDVWSIDLRGFNLTDDAVFTGAESVFAANTLLTKAPGPTAKLVIARRF